MGPLTGRAQNGTREGVASAAPSVRVLGYTRVSTEEQGRSGIGLQAQERAIRAECDRRGWLLVEIARDVASGTSTRRRPELARCMATAEAGEIDVVMVAKLDRLARSVVDAGKLLRRARERRFNIVALDLGIDLSTSNGRLVGHVMAAVAEWEADRIGERQREAKAVQRSNGDPKQVSPAARTRIIELHGRGMSQRAIAERLNAEGMPGVGPRWHRSAVQRVLSYARRDAAGR